MIVPLYIAEYSQAFLLVGWEKKILSKKHKKRCAASRQQSLPRMIFNVATVRLIQQSILSFEKSLQRNTKPLPNLQFAQETLAQIKNKLDMMIQAEGWENETEFDYNEMWLMYTSLALYLAELRFSASPEQGQITACIALCKQFQKIIENTKS